MIEELRTAAIGHRGSAREKARGLRLSILKACSPRASLDRVIALSGVLVLAGVIVLTYALAQDLGDGLTRNTVRLSLVWYAAAVLLMTHLQRNEWRAATTRGRIARWCWGWGMACFLVHLAMAFHFYHHWSHADAFEHTRLVSGTGEGIYVSYVFTWVWIVDVFWWWFWPERYAARSAWIGWIVHGFMTFVIFNGMVVFESGTIRWAGLAMFSVLAVAWVSGRGLLRLRIP